MVETAMRAVRPFMESELDVSSSKLWVRPCHRCTIKCGCR